jgi:hypothetical protein
MEKITVSIHIPKCGGTSMAKMLCAEFKTLLAYQGRTYGKLVISTNQDNIMDEISFGTEYDFSEVLGIAKSLGFTHIHGNIPLDFIKPHVYNVNLITFVREPKERLHSEYVHNILRFNINDMSEVDFYRHYNNSLYHYTRGRWELFSFIGRFENYSEDIKRLGIQQEVHENKSENKKPPVGCPDDLDKYTTIDQEIYAKLA